MIARYSGISPKGDLIIPQRLGEKLSGRSFLHINSTRAGGRGRDTAQDDPHTQRPRH